MSKHQHTKAHPTNQANRAGTSVSVDPEVPNQFKEQMESPDASLDDGFVPSYEDVQRRAYQIHEEKGGNDLDNWLEAERIIRSEHQVQH